MALLRPYHDAVRSEIESFGGVVEKFIGDAVVGMFGVVNTAARLQTAAPVGGVLPGEASYRATVGRSGNRK